MMKVCLVVCSLGVWFSLGAIASSAQEIVHALTGTVVAANPAAKTIQINTDDGSEGLFKDMTRHHASLEAGKALLASLEPANQFTAKNAHVIVFYYGDDAVRTAVGLEPLSPGPLETSSGVVTHFDRRQHLLTIRSEMGVTESFHIEPKTAVETVGGVVEGYKFGPSKGEQVSVVASAADGGKTAEYIYAN